MITRNAIRTILGTWVALLVLMAAVGLAAFAGSTKSVKRDMASGSTVQKNDILVFRVLEVLPKNGEISAYEPVIIKTAITNASSDPATIWASSDQSERIEIRNADGRLVGASPVYSYADTASFVHRLGPRQTARAYFIPSVVYQFKTPGKYNVRIMLLRPSSGITQGPSDLGHPRAEVTIPVTVRPPDVNRLKKRCSELVRPRPLDPNHLDEIPPKQNMMALWSLRHNAALPTLKFVADNWGDYSYSGGSTAVAIRRIGTPESAALLKTIASRSDRMGKAARSVAKELPRIHSDDYFTDWRNVNTAASTVDDFLYYYRHRQWDRAKGFFSDHFRHVHAAEFKTGRIFSTNASGKSFQSILNDPRSRALGWKKQGKFTIVDVGIESGGHAEGQIRIARLQLTGAGEWHLTDFPGVK